MLGAHQRLRALCSWLAPLDDVLRDRVVRPDAPSWCERRGWTEFLLSLDDASVEAAEREGPAMVLSQRPGAPWDLQALAGEALELSSVRSVDAPAPGVLRRASPRKRDQVEALASLAPTGATRIVDFGSGHGHLTRRLAAALDLPAVGLERSETSVATARAIEPRPSVRFEVVDVADLDARDGDLLVGLHACGDLGDALVRCAARTGAAVLLVSCCPQKTQSDPRRPLSSHGLTFDKSMLGLANLAAIGESGVASADAMERRRRRYALRSLLEASGLPTAPGEEAQGINRRRFARPLEDIAPLAFARRGRVTPNATAIREADERSRIEHARVRRFTLPRSLLARPLELALVLDRAAMLEEAGGAPEVVEAFPRSRSPRNLALICQRW